MNLLSSFPSAVDMQRVFYWQNKEFLAELKHAKTQATLQAEWAGPIWKRGEGLLGTWQSRYAIVRNSRLEYWLTIRDAKSGIPPKNYILLSHIVEDLTSADEKHMPKDSVGVAIYDIQKMTDLDSSHGRKYC